MARDWRRNAKPLASDFDACASSGSEVSSASVVDARTAVEREACQTLAARRVAENKLAIVQAEAKIRSYADKDKTVALERLGAARMEQRINEAKAKSQASFKKCDESMKSLGSSGSAGEYALKQEVRKAKENEALHKYVREQLDYAIKFASPEVKQRIAEMPPPEMPDAFEVMGDCPSEFDEDERESYYLELQQINEENAKRFSSC